MQFSLQKIESVCIIKIYLQFRYSVSLIFSRVTVAIMIGNNHAANLLRKSFAYDFDDTINTHNVRYLFCWRSNLELCRCKYRFMQRHNRIILNSSSINWISAKFPDFLDIIKYSKIFDLFYIIKESVKEKLLRANTGYISV